MSRSVVSALREILPGAFETIPPGSLWRVRGPGVGEPIQIYRPGERVAYSRARRAPKQERPWRRLSWDWGEEYGPDPESRPNGDSLVAEISPELEARIRERGMEALAFYLSYHFSTENWGIYIREDGLRHVAGSVFRRVYEDPEACLQAAFQLLYDHEYFHYLTDVAATAMEFHYRTPLYLPRFSAHCSGTTPWSLLEEGVANAYALASFSKATAAEAARRFMVTQPLGYRDLVDWAYRQSLPVWCRKLAAEILGSRATAMTSIPLAELLFDTKGAAVGYSDVPVYLVPCCRRTARGPILRFVTSIPMVTEDEAARKKLGKLGPDVQRRWLKVKSLLARDVHHPSLRFEKLRGVREWSVRLDRANRAKLRLLPNGLWELADIGRHDDVY